MNGYQEDYFLHSNANILENESGDHHLREIQRAAYVNICEHFLLKKSKEDAVAILPTGSGKTGVMAIAPFGISKSRVLIITPQLVIKDNVMDSLDPSSPKNFWLRQNVFKEYNDLPIVVEYDKDTHDDELKYSNIVILNIHKLNAQSRNSLLKRVNNKFFDMIIIDEAHHSPARTWQNALNYFSEAKVLKLTGTPFRADRKKIEGKVVIDYRLGKAMHDGIVKTLQNFVLRPEKVYLTIDDDETKKFTIEELRELKIKDSDYITRSVALSPECNKQIVNSSVSELLRRKSQSDVPHKIIAVCCSIKHAENVKRLYESTGLRVVIVHSRMKKRDCDEALRKIEANQADVVIHVAKLGEGYDHPYLSVAAIFRPYRSLAPYSQFIGRILRRIPDSEAKGELDNIGVIIAHQELGLGELWNEYKQEEKYCDILKKVEHEEPKERSLEKKLEKDMDIGIAQPEGNLNIDTEYYEYTKAAEEYEKYKKEINEKAKKLKSIFPDMSHAERERLVMQKSKSSETNELIKNPKKYRMILRKNFDESVRYDVPAEIILNFNLEANGHELLNLPLDKYNQWILLKKVDNLAVIAIYLNSLFKREFGSRDNWTIADYKTALNKLDEFKIHICDLIRSIL